MDSSFWFDTVNLGWSIVNIEGSQVIKFPNCFSSLKITFVLANSVDPDEILHYVALYLGLHCLLNDLFGSQ